MSNDWQHDEWWKSIDDLAIAESRRAIGITGDREDANDG